MYIHKPKIKISSPIRLLMIVILSTFLVEILLMYILPFLVAIPKEVISWLDSILLAALTFPIVYYFSFRPMAQHLAKREQAENALKQANDELETRIKERTASLMMANNALQIEISQRQQVEQNLRQSEARYRRLFEDGVLGMFQSSLEGRLLAVNPAFSRIFGYSSPEEVLSSVQDIATGLFLKPHLLSEIICLAKKSPDLHTILCDFRRKDGSSFVVNLHLRTITDAQGQVMYFEGIIEDISEQKQAELEIRNLARFPAENPNPVMRISQEGVILYANKACQFMLDIWNYQVGDLIQVNFRRFIDKIIASGQNREVEVPFGEQTYSLLFSPIPGTGYVNGYGTNITQRKQAEKALLAAKEEVERSLAQLSTIMDNMSDGLYVFDPQGNILLMNQAMLTLSGLEGIPKEHFQQYASRMKVRDGQGNVVPSADLPIARALRGETVQDAEYNVLRLDTDKNYTAQYSVALVRDTNDQVEICIMTVRDISERTRAEQAIKDSEALFRTTFENAAIGVSLVGLDGKFMRTNGKLAEILGYTDEELQNLTFTHLTHPEDHLIGVDFMKHMMAGEINKATFEKRYLHKTGQVIWASISTGIVRKDSGQPLYFVTCTQDITESKQADQEIQQHLTEIETLLQIAIAGTEAGSPNELVQRAITAGANLYPRDFGIGLVDETCGLVRFPFYLKSNGQPAPDMLLGQGVTGRAAKTGIAIRLNDVTTDPGYFVADPGSRSELCVPVMANGNAIAVINVESEQLAAFGEADEHFLQGLAGQMGTALEKIRLFEKTEQQLNHLSALRDIDQSILSNLDLKDTLRVVLNQVTTLLKVDAADIALFNPNSAQIQLIATCGLPETPSNQIEIHLEDPFTRQVFLEEKPFFIPDLQKIKDQIPLEFWEAIHPFCSALFTPLIAKGEHQGVLQLYQRTPLKPTEDWMRFLEALAGQAAIAIDNAQLFSEQQETNRRLLEAYDETLDGWSKAMDLHDHETEGHSQRVADLTLKLARQLNVPEEHLAQLYRGAKLHDIGKMAIPDRILTKPGPLTDEEWTIMRQHPVLAFDFLSPIKFLHPAMDVPYCHHEKWDGNGYPRGLKGEEIPLFARIFAVIDVYDALTSDRPYRLAWSKQQALDYIKKQSEKQFDPQIVEEFKKLMEKDKKRK